MDHDVILEKLEEETAQAIAEEPCSPEDSHRLLVVFFVLKNLLNTHQSFLTSTSENLRHTALQLLAWHKLTKVVLEADRTRSHTLRQLVSDAVLDDRSGGATCWAEVAFDSTSASVRGILLKKPSWRDIGSDLESLERELHDAIENDTPIDLGGLALEECNTFSEGWIEDHLMEGTIFTFSERVKKGCERWSDELDRAEHFGQSFEQRISSNNQPGDVETTEGRLRLVRWLIEHQKITAVEQCHILQTLLDGSGKTDLKALHDHFGDRPAYDSRQRDLNKKLKQYGLRVSKKHHDPFLRLIKNCPSE